MSNSAKKPLDMLIERFTGWVKRVHVPVKQNAKEFLNFTSSCRGKFEDEWSHHHRHS